MSELGGAVSYLYWSERRIESILTDNGIQIPESSTKITSPSVYGLAPVYEHSRSKASPQRADIANLIERSLGQSIISRFDADPGPRYARGVGTLVFGQFINDFDPPESTKHRALMFTSCDYDSSDKGSVAICLFGSMENFAGYVKARDTQRDEGWTSSSAPDVLAFLQGQWTEGRGYPSTRAEMAVEALKIADGQGIKDADLEPLKGWRRSFTYGDIQDVAEWLAEIYLDVDLLSAGEDREDGFRRVIVGAPIWVRTPRLRAIRLYDEYSSTELEAIERDHDSHERNSPGRSLRRRFGRLFSMR